MNEPLESLLQLVKKEMDQQYNHKELPFLSLCFVQSLDGAISGETGKQTALSCSTSFHFTHGLRSIHQAILVGKNTVLVDNPKLTNRHYGNLQQQPIPIVLDSHLSIPIDSFLVQNARNPIIVASKQNNHAPESKRTELESFGCRILLVEDMTDLYCIFSTLKSEYGIQSIMIEGGGQVISNITRYNRINTTKIVTVCPKILLPKGYKPSSGTIDYSKEVNDASADMIVPSDCDLIYVYHNKF
jgi:diaminohydroxyphosphoribosylaminopyrimidine deaminase/5-amino-6-(5-phosphoribosylamino)uracil reductase